MALETQGYQFQAPIPDLSREHPLTSLRSLSFSGGTNNPVNIQPLAGWKVESAHPEQVAIGAIQGAGAIGQGITAAYMSKQAKKEEADKLKKAQDREDSLLTTKFGRDKVLAGMKSAESEARLQEVIRHNQEVEELKRRIEETGGNKGKGALAKRSIFGDQSQTSQNTDQQATDQQATETPPDATKKPTFFGTSPQTEYMKKGSNVTPDGVPLTMTEEQTNILAGLTPDISQPSNQRMLTADLSGSTPYTGLTDQAASNIFANYNASSDPFGFAKSAPLQNLQALSEDEVKQHFLAGETATQKQFGQLPSQNLTPSQIANSALKRSYGFDGIYPEDQARAFIEYAQANNLAIPHVAQKADGIEVKFPQGATPLQSAKQKNFDSLLSMRAVKTLQSEPKQFESENNVKNYTGQRGLMQMLVRLSPTYESAMKDPNHNAIPAAGMAQLMAQAETGGVPTVSAVSEYLHSQGYTDTLEQMKAKYLAGAKELLTPRQTTQIYELLLEEAKAQASLANQTVASWQDTYRGRGVKNPEKYIAPYILPKTKDDATKEVSDMIPEIARAKQERDRAEKSKDMKSFADADFEWRELSKKAHSLQEKIETSTGHIINRHEIENSRQGFLSPVPVNELDPEAFQMLKSGEMGNLNLMEQQFYMGGNTSNSTDDSEK